MIETLRMYATVKVGFYCIYSVSKREDMVIKGDFDECVKHWCAANGYKYTRHTVMDEYNIIMGKYTVVCVEVEGFNSNHLNGVIERRNLRDKQ